MGFFNSDEIESVLISEERLAEKIAEMGKQITEDYQGKDLVIIGVLRGSVTFMVDLMRHIELPVSLDFISVSSYGSGTKSTGVVKIIKDLDDPIAGKDVLIIEDILDSGNTLTYLMNILTQRKPNSIRIATLLDKPERRTKPVKPEYVGFVIPDEFVIGYGLDYNNKYRNLPFVGILDPKVYS